MKLVTYLDQGKEALGLVMNEKVYPMNSRPSLPKTMMDLLDHWETAFPLVQQWAAEIPGQNLQPAGSLNQLNLMAPVPRPRSCRDGYAFRQHVASARRNRGVEMIPEFDQYPVFYFTNHQAVKGPGDLYFMPDHFERLDFELEVAIVTGKKGRNFRAEEADEYIAGYMIMNDLSARTLQMEEMKLNLGPAKGKDFCTVIGPMLVTPDELEPYKVDPKPGHVGHSYRLGMRCSVNGVQVSEGNMADMDWTFAEILERCAYGVDIHPGEVIGSGTVGTGCFLELNGTARRLNPDAEPQWLKDGDLVEMEVEGLGTLTNRIKAESTDWSILNRKKNGST